MNDALRMQISAFVDGELPENETELLLRRLSQDAALRQLVAQYLGIGRLVRGEREVPGMSGLRNRIATALGEQPTEAVPAAAGSGSRYLKPAAGIAVAASVAALALVGLRQADVPAVGDPEALHAAAESDAGYTEPTPAEVFSGKPSETLMQYYVRHGETSADLGANGILARLVTLELRHEELVEVDPQDDPSDNGRKNSVRSDRSALPEAEGSADASDKVDGSPDEQ